MQIVPVDGLDDTVQHIVLFRFALIDRFPQTRDNSQIGTLAQFRSLPEGLHQRDQIFLPHRPGDGEDQRFVSLPQKRRKQSLRAVDVGGRRPLSLHPGNDAMNLGAVDRGIARQLAFAFIARGCDDGVRFRNGAILRFEAILLFLRALRAHLVVDQRMRGVDERYSEFLPRGTRHLGGVGEMGMYDVGTLVPAAEHLEKGLFEGGQIACQGFL